MEKQVIVAISREFGSGGHAIAEQIAKDMGIKLYDRNILEEIAEEKSTKAEVLEQYDEKPRNYILTRRVRGYSNSMAENLAEMQFEYIKKKAESGESFVIVGRCAETVLHGTEGLITIFILGDRSAKIKRIEEKYKLSEAEAIAKMNRHDKHRKMYHNKYSKYKWGDSRNYDVCLNSSRLGVEGTVKALEEYINDRIQSKRLISGCT
ncbi:MAG: cytidylate kinase-like family protein [Lachnospiraceae bacterium]|nr:cytidylate kinase-like family protein [Lachnospiraceae bacterium]